MDETGSRRRQSRSVVTRERLIRASLDEIFEVGYHAATTQGIARRASVSRGALLHHFPSRADIVIATMEALLDDGTSQIQSVTDELQRGDASLADFVDFLWRLFSGRFFYLSLEMITESRNDPELRLRMIPVVRRFHEALDAIWTRFCEGSERPPHQARVILNLTVCLMRGMGVQTVLRPEPGYYREMVEAWKTLLPHLIGGEPGEIMFGGPRSGSKSMSSDIPL